MRHKIVITSVLFLISHFFVSANGFSPEVRAIWLTTNLGLDWPVKETDPGKQKKALCQMLDKLNDANFNLVFFQVQANGDVLWDSKYEPPMADVTGNGAGKLKYDICSFIIKECHKRNMECHAWIVPFRLGTAKQAARYKGNSIKHPYANTTCRTVDHNGIRYFDPSDTASHAFLIKLYRELVRKYAFDGIQLDYTRYPGKGFNDTKAYATRKQTSMSLNQWRRNNINTFVTSLYSMIAEERPGMIVGSAPIGSYKPIEPWKNATAYETFQQDPGQWIADGCHDMIVPQMYWGERNGFSAHIKAWAEVAGRNCTLVVGLAPYKMETERSWTPDSIASQIAKARTIPGVSGVCFFRAEHVLGNSHKSQQLYKTLRYKLFRQPAKLPWDTFE